MTPVLYSPVISCSNRASSGGRTRSVSRSLSCFGTLSFTEFIGPCVECNVVGVGCKVVSVGYGEVDEVDRFGVCILSQDKILN
jgi:hypothetical protein